MTIRIIHIIAPKKYHSQINKEIKDSEVVDSWEVLDNAEQNIIFSILITLEKSQAFLDSLQPKIDTNMVKMIYVSTVETILQQQEQNSKTTKSTISKKSDRVPQEELYGQVDNDVTLNINYILLTVLSTIVAALGLLENQITAIIAAMVIAPMLEPNLAMALAVVLGDSKLFIKSMKTNAVGIILCILLSMIIGFLWPYKLSSVGLLIERTNVGYSAIALALASGAAAALSLTSRLSTALVGVMVAVALLPPLVTSGILLGSGAYIQSLWAGVLFAVNIVSINISANLVFLFQGIHSRKWHEKKKAKVTIFWYLLFWVVSLLALFASIYFHQIHI